MNIFVIMYILYIIYVTNGLNFKHIFRNVYVLKR